MRIVKETAPGDGFASGTHRVRLASVEEIACDFNDGKGAQTRILWTFEDPNDESRTVRGFSGVRLTQNARLAQYVCALAGVAFDRLPDALDMERLVGRTAIAQVEVTPEGRSKVVALVADVQARQAAPTKTAPQPRPPSNDFEDDEQVDDIPF